MDAVLQTFTSQRYAIRIPAAAVKPLVLDLLS